ncbi:uncharacterized protein [Amphiura filiformis]|uniref:uncharacterized protein n=1 Tax=Amphiura filiformis TaxID=82378 RepID=UPI003B21B909
MPVPVSHKDALQPDAVIYQSITSNQRTMMISGQEITTTCQHKVATLVNTLKRATEECALVKVEMACYLTTLCDHHAKLEEMSRDGHHTKRELILLFCAQEKVSQRYFRARDQFKKHIELPPVPDHMLAMEELVTSEHMDTSTYSDSDEDASSDEDTSSDEESYDDNESCDDEEV